MRPRKLYIHGINSFYKPAFIDFELLGEGGIFGVFGKTGSGKSTIVDAVIFALYGDTNEKALNLADYINRRLNEAEVRLEFSMTEINGDLTYYEVYRRIGVDRKTGAAKSAKAELWDVTSERRSVAVGTRDVTNKVTELIGLNLQEFSNCVILEQNKYDNFVRATDAERKKMVGNLFGLQRYGDELAEEVKKRESALRLQTTDLAGRIKEHEGATPEALAMLKERYAQVKQEAESLHGECDALRVKEAESAEAYRLFEARRKVEEEVKTAKTAADAAEKELSRVTKERDALRAQSGAAGSDAQAEAQKLSLERASLEASMSIDSDMKASKDKLKASERELNKLIKRHSDDEVKKQECEAIITECETELFHERMAFNDLTGATLPDDLRLIQTALASYIGALGAKTDGAQQRTFETAQTKAMIDERTREREAAEMRKSAAETRLNDLNIEKQSVSALLDLAEIDLDATRQENVVNATIATLHEGDTCPVCGNRIVHLPQADTFQLEQLSAQVDEFRLRIKSLDEARLEAAQEYAVAMTESDALGREIERLNRTLAVNTVTGEDAENGELAECEKIAKAIGAAVNDREGAEKELNAIAERAKSVQPRIEALLKEVENEQNRLDQLETRRMDLLGATKTVAAALKAVTKKLEAVTAQAENYAEKSEAAERDYHQATQDHAVAVARLETALARLDEMPKVKVEPKAHEQLRARRIETEQREREAMTAAANTATVLERMERDFESVQNYRKQKAELDAKLALLERIKKMTGGGKLMEWLAEEYIEDFTALAAEKLSDLTGGEMELEYTQKGFYIIDNFNNRAERKVATVSGGETFLVSLSLAVAIATKLEERAGARHIEFLFIDEGFGALSGDKIDLVMDALCSLSSQDFMVGFISHVQEMQTRIPKQLVVTRDDIDEGSVVKAI